MEGSGVTMGAGLRMQVAISNYNAWDLACAALKKQIGQATYNSWINPLAVISLENGVLSLSAPTKFIKDWVENNYKHRLKQYSGGEIRDIRIDVAANNFKPAVEVAEKVVVDFSAYKETVGSRVDARYTFENYITDGSNELAVAAAKRVAELGENAGFNPVYIHSAVGLGKTHLMHAIANYSAKHFPGREVIYLSAEKFMHQFLRAIRERNMIDFKDQLRGADVLMVDDFQFIVGKEASQEELFQTFNAIIESGKQLVISCDRSPADLEALPERMRSRLASGLVVDIANAGAELRLNILRSKVAQLGVEVPEEIVNFLAENITSNVRELEGALNRIVARATLVKSEVTLQNAKIWVADLLQIKAKSVGIEQIQEVVAAKYDLKSADLLSSSRAANIAKARHVAMFLSKKLTTKSLPEIGKLFGGKDHTTVLHACRKIEELLASDAAFSAELDALATKIKY